MNNKHIMVTGAGGFIGNNISNYLCKKKFIVHAYYNSKIRKIKNKNIKYLKRDLTKNIKINKKISTLVHCAALTPPAFDQIQCLKINQPITFSTTNPQVTHWQVKDISGNIVFPHQASPNFTFTSSGKYIIEPGFVQGFTFYQIIIGTPSTPINCEKIITVGENQPIINLNQSSITVCSGSWINLGQEISSILHIEGPADYFITTSNGAIALGHFIFSLINFASIIAATNLETPIP